MNSNIFNIAKSLFYEKGYSKTKISDITGKLGLVPANFYRYYNSKEDLLKDIIISESSEYIRNLNNYQNKTNFHEKIKLIFEVNLKFLFEKPHFFAFLIEIKSANYKLDHSTRSLAGTINTLTKDSLKSILELSTLDDFTKRVAHKVLIDDLNIFLDNLIKDSTGNICPTRLLTINFHEKFNDLLKLTESICYGLGLSNDAFSRLDKVSGILKEDFFLELLTKNYNYISHHKNNVDILYITISSQKKKKTSLSKDILHSIGAWLNSSFRDSDQAGLIGDNNFALLLSKHSPSTFSLLLERCLKFEKSLQKKYPTFNNFTLNSRILSIEEGDPIDFKIFFQSEETIKKHTLNKIKHPVKVP